MIPLKLNIRNFLSYRENVPTLDFAGIHVACLCGDNGHGKSALLDAITWCLWGKARGQVQDDLVSYGADEARVELEFQARNNRYRVIRSRRRGGGRRRQGASDLQLQALDDSDGAASVISGNTVRETQAKIEQLVGMDYDTFINSAFLLQGRADEFTNKTPAERKAVLAAILGLAAYDRFQGRARAALSDKRGDADRLAGSVGQMQQELDNLGDPSEELAGVAQRLDGLNRQMAEGNRAREELREQVGQLERQAARLDEEKRAMVQVHRDIEQLEANTATAQSRIREYRELLAQGEDINRGVELLEQARQRLPALEEARRQSEALRQRENELTQAIGIERARLEAQIEQLRQRVERDLTPKAEAEAELLQQQATARQSLDALSESVEKLNQQRGQLQVIATQIGEAKTTAERYQAEGEQLKEKLHLLNNTDPEAAVCPLCQTPLSQDGCHLLAQTYQAEIEEKRDLYRSNRRQLQGLEKEQAELEKELPRQEQALTKTGNQLRERLTRLESQLQESRAAGEELAQVQQSLSASVAALEGEDFAPAPLEELAEVAGQLAALAYDEQEYQQAYRRIQELQPYDERHTRLSQATARLPEEETALAQAGEMLSRRKAELAERQEQLNLGEAALAQLPEAQTRLQAGAQTLAELERSQQAALARQGLLEGQLKRRESLREELGESRERLSRLQEEQGIYQELFDAFGRQGIQAMLIETVVPRLEEEANRLLGRMTDNRMHVKLETQREPRSGAGEPIETLQINVSDELGLRSYEMYSGGEAFRVNLALRIALSRVLSQRTGAPLPTLFIDEGFGTQDASGRERILDVISAIEDDFDKIIVITHLDDLKDMFPVRIEVQKDANGSTFWLT